MPPKTMTMYNRCTGESVTQTAFAVRETVAQHPDEWSIEKPSPADMAEARKIAAAKAPPPEPLAEAVTIPVCDDAQSMPPASPAHQLVFVRRSRWGPRLAISDGQHWLATGKLERLI